MFLANTHESAVISVFYVNTVQQTNQQGGNWQRELSRQMTGFGFGGAFGMMTGKGAIAWLSAIGLGLTPVGWVVMIGIGVTAGFAAGYFMDKVGQDFAIGIYDRGR